MSIKTFLGLESYGQEIARKCKVGTRAEIEKRLGETGWGGDPCPEIMAEVLLEMEELGLTEVIENSLLC